MRTLTLLLVAMVAAGCPNPEPGSCGDGLCRPAEAESCASCPVDCMAGCEGDAGLGVGCGDFVCGASESCSSCPGDCGACPPVCGDFVCSASETCATCATDCGPCACTPSTCGGGCCTGTTCRSGDDTFACGTAGAECVDCGGRAVCTDGVCLVDPESLWTVVIDSVALTPADYSGAGWDVGSGPDPLIWVRVGAETAPPAEIDGPDNTLTIMYSVGNRVMSRRAADIASFLRFEIWEDDTPGDDGVCFFTYTGGVGFDFSTATWTARCVEDAGRMISNATLTWHIEPG